MSDGLDLEPGPDAPDEKPPAKAKPPRRGGGRPPAASVSSELKKTIEGGLDELAEWLKPRDEQLAATLQESSPRIAEYLAIHAAKRARLKRTLLYGFAKGGPFAALRAFGPLARGVSDRLGVRRDQAGHDDQAEEAERTLGLDEPSPIPPDAGDGGPVRPDA